MSIMKLVNSLSFLFFLLFFFSFKSIVGIGVGAGAYILAKFAVSTSQMSFFLRFCFCFKFTFNAILHIYSQLIFPDLVEGLVLLNIDPNGKGWIDWAATKLSGLTSTLPDTVLAHLFSQVQY